MQLEQSKRSSLFLLELIIAIFFFILASAFCVRFFVKAHLIEEEAESRNLAVHTASSVAELLKTDDLNLTKIKEYYSLAIPTENGIFVHFDENFDASTEENSVYLLELQASYEDWFHKGFIQVYQNDNLLYELEVKYYKIIGGNE